MIGKYFKDVEQEIAEAAGRNKDRARQLAERVIERVTPNADGSLPDPGINRLTGKPNPPESAPTNVKPSGSTVDYGGASYNLVGVFGDGIRPRIARGDKVIPAKAYVLGDKMYVLLDPTVQEGVAGPKNCWPGHRKVGTKPGTGKNAGKRVNDCEKIGEDDQGVAFGAEDEYSIRSAVLDVLQTIYDGASAGEEMIDTVADELGDYYDEVKQSGDSELMKAYRFVREKGADAEDNPKMMAKIVQRAMSVLGKDQGVAEGGSSIPFAGKKVGHKEGPAGQLKGTDPKGYPKGKLVGGGM